MMSIYDVYIISTAKLQKGLFFSDFFSVYIQWLCSVSNRDLYHLVSSLNKLTCLLFIFLISVSGEVPENPVLSPVSNHVFERRLIEKFVSENGTDPITGDVLSESDLIDIKGLFTINNYFHHNHSFFIVQAYN